MRQNKPSNTGIKSESPQWQTTHQTPKILPLVSKYCACSAVLNSNGNNPHVVMVVKIALNETVPAMTNACCNGTPWRYSTLKRDQH
ncbi:hypothetical protein O9929_23610 [Vibrio lentus]|nr:hypothetical protein [Vibrio lentus]